MKSIWHRYKIWLLIGFFYGAYCVAKGFKMVKQIDIHRNKLNADRSNLKCGWLFPTDLELFCAFCAKKFWNLSLTGHVDYELHHGSATNPDEPELTIDYWIFNESLWAVFFKSEEFHEYSINIDPFIFSTLCSIIPLSNFPAYCRRVTTRFYHGTRFGPCLYGSGQMNIFPGFISPYADFVHSSTR